MDREKIKNSPTLSKAFAESCASLKLKEPHLPMAEIERQVLSLWRNIQLVSPPMETKRGEITVISERHLKEFQT
jgi:hypothetical protein